MWWSDLFTDMDPTDFFNFSFLPKYGTAFVRGIEYTLLLAVVSVLLAILPALGLALMRLSRKKPVRWLSGAYIAVFRSTPMLVQLMIMGFVVFQNSRNFTMVGALALGINSGAYVAEIIRGGLMSLDPGQMEAGRSLGLGYLPTMTFIVVPQAFKAILPALGNEFITLLKDTSLISAIAGKEVVYFAKAIGAKTYDYMFPLLIIAVMYLILVLIFTWLQGILERRLRASDRR